MNNFVTILKKYENTHTGVGTDKNTSHSYGQVYDELFKKYKNTAKAILEIGIDGGYALLAYTEYFTNSMIYGLDIDDRCNDPAHQHPNIRLFFGNALLPTVHNRFNDEYDIIIEDASHLPEDQIQHFHDFAPKLAKGGVYIIEDINQQHVEKVYNGIKQKATDLGYTLELLDLRHIKNRFDDILILARKP